MSNLKYFYGQKFIFLLLFNLFISACSSSDPSKWNRQEKGTAIGGLGGAGLGALIGSQSGNTAAGAVIGGAAGAGGGALIGNELDKERERDEDRRHHR